MKSKPLCPSIKAGEPFKQYDEIISYLVMSYLIMIVGIISGIVVGILTGRIVGVSLGRFVGV